MDHEPKQLSQQTRQDIKDELLASNDVFVSRMPKVELHVHIEGTLTPARRWELARRKGIAVPFGRGGKTINTLCELEQAYADVISSAQLPQFAHCAPADVPATFFESYYSGFEVLQTEQDFYDLALDYFKYASSIQVRYCEVFFDPQGHTSRGVSWSDMMEGFRAAQKVAKQELNVESQWIMCFLRDQPLESAMKHYEEAHAYRDMIVGIGLDSNEHNHPPWLFDELYLRARADGFKITAHCDVGVKNTHDHIRHVATKLGGTGADRIDHGLNVGDLDDLTALIANRAVPMTICPWAYLRRESYDSIAERLTRLIAAGITVCISSDSPAYMDSSFLLPNLLMAKRMCRLSDSDMAHMMRNSVEMCWGSAEVKESIMNELAAMTSSV